MFTFATREFSPIQSLKKFKLPKLIFENALFTMDTPKKVVPKRGRKPKPPSVHDFCRICGCSFKNYYGDFGEIRVSTECLFSIPRRSGMSKRPLYLLLKNLGYLIEENDVLCSRVCAKCGTKIRRAEELKVFFDAGLCRTQETAQESPDRFKRMMSSPSSAPRKSVKTNSPKTTDIGVRETPKEIPDQGSERNVRARKQISLQFTEAGGNDEETPDSTKESSCASEAFVALDPSCETNEIASSQVGDPQVKLTSKDKASKPISTDEIFRKLSIEELGPDEELRL